jgi:hypothetical protein
MATASANFIFGTQHAFAGFSSDFGLFDSERLSSNGVQGSAHRGYHHFLTGSYIGGAAYNGKAVFTIGGHNSTPQSVGVGVLLATEHFAHNQAGQLIGGLAQSFGTIYFEPNFCQSLTKRIDFNRLLEVMKQPIVGDFHSLIFMDKVKSKSACSLFFLGNKRFYRNGCLAYHHAAYRLAVGRLQVQEIHTGWQLRQLHLVLLQAGFKLHRFLVNNLTQTVAKLNL